MYTFNTLDYYQKKQEEEVPADISPWAGEQGEKKLGRKSSKVFLSILTQETQKPDLGFFAKL